MSDSTFATAVAEARVPKRLSVEGAERLMYDVSGIPGAERLPRALVCLLENVVRRAASWSRTVV